MGLIWLQSDYTLMCPYIYLSLVFSTFKTEISHMLEKYGILKAISECQLFPAWQDWETFVANFRCLKSKLYDGKEVKFTDLHHGMHLHKSLEKLVVKGKKLDLVHSKHQIQTNYSGLPNTITDKYSGTEKSLNDQIFVLNAPSSNSGDGCCVLSLKSGKNICEVHQYKYVKGTYDSGQYRIERKKAADTTDVFLMFSVYNIEPKENVPLSENCGLLSKSTFNSYFGPFAGRAFFLDKVQTPNINEAPYFHLLNVHGVGEVLAENIVTERGKRKFSDMDDAFKRLNKFPRFSIELLEKFQY
eukprot:TRINITY_DN5906_c0_g1_i1.p1 TRINITY_DN5906_c0_g1~~TRINITY_DN5906_c0_g1_i1.p1  ORF type:complete len:300 (-),score=21.15 TRINITY_DN5906_c0_g1_i1:47-946(-)